MNININQMVSISEANQNFSKVARIVDKTGEVYIFKNNRPKYRLVDLESESVIEMTDEEKIDFIAARVLKQYHRAFEELAK
ncbi:MAG: type II toxin-antitoxin system prevent-host-death family antitoxin [Clostridia bacterium]|nr:type II toxin-antitoxin system prevent-host-death family antitoxin [Clostridia bacterium]